MQEPSIVPGMKLFAIPVQERFSITVDDVELGVVKAQGVEYDTSLFRFESIPPPYRRPRPLKVSETSTPAELLQAVKDLHQDLTVAMQQAYWYNDRK